MKTNTGFLVFVLGLLMTLLGVGGVEQSISNNELFGATLVACVGLSIMYVGTLGIRNGEYYD